MNAGFGCGIGSFAGSTGSSPHGRNVDDPSTFHRDHMWNGGTAAIEDGRKIRLKKRRPVFVCHIGKQTKPGNAGVIDQNVDTAGFFFNLTEHGFYLGRITNISGFLFSIICWTALPVMDFLT